MKNLVIIGANDFQLPLILKAKAKGYTTHVFAWDNGDVGQKEADYFYPISIMDIEDIYQECLKINPVGICSIASDLAMLTVNELAKRFNLPHNNDECVINTTNKYKMRLKLKKENIPTPQFMIVDNDKAKTDFQYPLIVKPTDRSGSRGITKVTNEIELEKALEKAINYSFEHHAIIEEYIDGPEYSFEAFAFNSNYQFLQITKKFTTNAPHFIETAHIEPAAIEGSLKEEIITHMNNAFKALDIQNGAIHAEFKISPNGIRIIEIGARMGGDCIGSHLVEISTGYDFVSYVIDIAVGKQPELVETRKPKLALVKFIFTQQDLNEFNTLKKLHPELIELEYIHGDLNESIIDSASRHGYYVLALDSLEIIKGIINYEN